MKKLRSVIFIMVFIALTFLPLSALAHSGRTDSSGGHRDNKNRSGLGYYHYHCGGHPPHLHPDGVCPYSTSVSSFSSNSEKVVPKETYASSVKFTSVPKKLNVGEDTKIGYKIYPNNATNKGITWKSGNEGVAIVDSYGVVKAVGKGKATITAITSNKKSASFKITVDEVLAKRLTIKDKPSEITVNQTVTLKAELLPENTTDKVINWVSNNSEIAQIDSNGNIKALKCGEVIITANQKDKSDSFSLIIKPAMADSIKITPISKRLQKGDTLSLEAIILPENTEDKTIKWTVDNETLATINNNILTSLKTGTVKVTATTINAKSDSIEVEIYSNEYTGPITGSIVLLGSGLVYYLKKKKKS